MSKMLLARSVVIFVSAMAMTRQEYNDLRGWQLPENENGSDAGYLIEDSEGEQNTDKFKGFVQWLPKSEFERKYIVGSLPHRQLRSKGIDTTKGWCRSLPHRQLRSQRYKRNAFLQCSLPHRQLRRKCEGVPRRRHRSLPHRQLRS